MDYYSTSYPAIYRGKVESNIDPKNLGRCRVRVPAVHGQFNYTVDSLPWARPIAPTSVNENRGSVNIPDVGDIVWIMFEGANKDYPVYLGGTYALQDILINKDEVIIYTENNNSISYNRLRNSYKVNVGKNSIEISNEGISIEGDLIVDGDVEIMKDLRVHGSYPCHGGESMDDIELITPEDIDKICGIKMN